MSSLDGALATVSDKMKKFRPLYEQNEMAVRDHIVNPVLRSLGWEPENPEEVQPNVSTEEGIPDYSLIKDGRKVLFIEAKKLGVDVEQPETIRQLARYCFGEGTLYGILTNGVVWLLFRSFEEGTKVAERIVWKVDAEGEEPHTAARKLSTISKENVDQIETLVKKVQILDEVWTSLLEAPEEMIRSLIPTVKNLIGAGYPAYQFDDPEIEDFVKERLTEMISSRTEPSGPTEEIEDSRQRVEGHGRIKLAGETFDVQNAYEILVNVANWIIRKGRLRPSDCPVPAGPKRYLVNKEPKHRYGDDFRAPRRLANGLYVETHYSRAGCINYSKRLLEKFGFPAHTLVVD